MADGFATRAIHAGRLPMPAEPPLAAPIWQTSTFAFDDAEHYAHTLHQPREGYVYTRYENPTTAALEATVANLEGAAEGLATASGMGAIATVLLSLAGTGDHVVAQRDLYGGTYSLLAHTAPRFGIEVSFVDAGDPDAVRAALRPTTRAIYAETVANPTMTVADLPALAGAAGAGQLVPVRQPQLPAGGFGDGKRHRRQAEIGKGSEAAVVDGLQGLPHQSSAPHKAGTPKGKGAREERWRTTWTADLTRSWRASSGPAGGWSLARTSMAAPS